MATYCILCVVFVVCYISCSCGLAGCLIVHSALFRTKAELASVCFNGKQTHHWKTFHVRVFCPFSIPYCLFLPYYSSALDRNVALLSTLQWSAVFSLLMSEGKYKSVLLYSPTPQPEGQITCLDTHWQTTYTHQCLLQPCFSNDVCMLACYPLPF